MAVINNQTNITTFNEASKYADATRVFRAKVKRRYYSGAELYDADWTTLTSYVLQRSPEDVKWGIEDQNYLTGVYRNSNLNVTFDNRRGKFNDPSKDIRSIWYDSATTYSINKSLLEIDVGFELPTGTTFWNTDPYFSGLMRYDTARYNEISHTMKLSIFSKLEWFRDINMYELISFERISTGSARLLTDLIFTYARENTPAALSMTFIANSPRQDIYYKNIEKYQKDVYKLFSSFARQTGSLFGINRKNEVFLTYFNNPNVQATMTGLEPLSVSIAQWSFNTSGALPDGTGNGHDLSGSCTPTFGKFGAGGQDCNYFGQPGIGFTTTNDYSFEFLFRIKAKANVNGSQINMTNSWAALASNDFGIDGEYLIFFGKNSGDQITTGSRDNVLPFTNSWADNVTEYFGENQWYYCYCELDRANTYRRLYINNTLAAAANNLDSLGALIIQAGNGNTGDSLEFDSMRVNNGLLTTATRDIVLEQMFGNKVEWNSTSVYDFYNYGPNSNISDKPQYWPGYKFAKNRIVVENPNYHKYDCRFYVGFQGQSISVSFKFGGSTTSFMVTTEASLNSAINASFERKVTSTITAASLGAVFTIQFPSIPVDDMIYARMLCTYIPSLPVVFTAIDKSGYIPVNTRAVGGDTAVTVLNFLRTNTQKDFFFDDTSSVQQYGANAYKLDAKDLMTDDPAEIALLAQAILDERSPQKDRMRIRARFMEGELDLLDRITIHWQSDYPEDWGVTPWDTEAWDIGEFGETAGVIDWQEKDFYVISMTHSFRNNYSEYLLREV